MSGRVIGDYLEPSNEIQGEDGEITTNNLLDEVSLYNLYDEHDSPEQDAERILNITYPTTTLTTIIEQATQHLNDPEANSEGGHVIGGDFGSGKSHIELVLYHLLDSPDLGETWLDRHGIDATLPAESQTAALQMLNLDREYDSLAVAVGEYLGVDEWTRGGVPGVHDIRDELEGQPTAIFIDEFERWFGMSSRSEYQDDNLGFLQNLLEAAGRKDTPLCVFVSLLFEDNAVQDIIPRTNPFKHDLSSKRDEKIQFLLHRLVGDITDQSVADEVVEDYANLYRGNKQIELDDYQQMEDRIGRQLPFHPATLELLMEKFSEQQGHQDARGLLHLLTEILGDSYEEVDLILTGDIDIFAYTSWFRFIDGELVSKYLNDYHRLGEGDGTNDEKEFDSHIEELLNIVLLHSLSRGGEEGANKHQMLLGTMRQGQNAHEIAQTFQNDVYGHAWHIFRINGEYAFDTDENPAARIEKKAADIHKNTAIQRAERLITEGLFDGRNNVYLLDPVNTEREIPDNKNLKIVVSLAAKRNYDDDFEELTTGQEREFSNTLVLVTPKQRSSIDSNTGIIELARKVVAGEQLTREEEVLPDGFDDIHDQHRQNLYDRVRDKYGTAHTSTERGLYPTDLSADDDESLYDATLAVVRPDISQLKSEVRDAVKEAAGGGIQYQHLLNDFYRNVSYTTLTESQELEDAVDSLCRDGDVKVGNYFEERPRTLGSDTVLVHSEYVETAEEDDEDDEPATITVDARSGGSGGGDGGAVADSGGGGSEVSEAAKAFMCPDCGEELEGTECECGFEFEASDIKEGQVTFEGGTADDLLEQFDDLKDEVEDEQELAGAVTTRFPLMGTLDASDKPSLIDSLEREVGYGWEIHAVELQVEGTLDADGVAKLGLDDDRLADHVRLSETLNIEPEEPLSRDELLNDVLLGLDVPSDASFRVSMEVQKDE